MKSTPLDMTVYGGGDCDDTERVVGQLDMHRIPYRLVMIDDKPDAERFVIFINNGFRSTPTLVFGNGNYKIVATEPTNIELEDALRSAGHNLSATQ